VGVATLADAVAIAVAGVVVGVLHVPTPTQLVKDPPKELVKSQASHGARYARRLGMRPRHVGTVMMKMKRNNRTPGLQEQLPLVMVLIQTGTWTVVRLTMLPANCRR
jgi:hypothetical protein